MPFVRFTKDFSVKISELSTMDYPTGWSGEVDDAIAAAAFKARAAETLNGEVPTESAKKK